jgi:hypothetical protein
MDGWMKETSGSYLHHGSAHYYGKFKPVLSSYLEMAPKEPMVAKAILKRQLYKLCFSKQKTLKEPVLIYNLPFQVG